MVPRFKEYDRDGNGYVSLDEATNILQRPPFNFPASKVGQLLQKFDKDGNGKLDIEEFADFYAEAKATYVYSLYRLQFNVALWSSGKRTWNSSSVTPVRIPESRVGSRHYSIG